MLTACIADCKGFGFRAPPNRLLAIADRLPQVLHRRIEFATCHVLPRRFGLVDAMDFNGLENAVGRLSGRQGAIARRNDNAACSLGYQTPDQTGKLGSTVQQGFNQAQAQLAECRCATRRGIDSVNYNGAINTAAIQKAVAEQAQKVLDTITGNRITGELTGSGFLKAASSVGYAAPMGIPDKHMECIKAVRPKGYGVAMPQIYALR